MEGHERSGEPAALARADRPLVRPVVHDHGDHDHHDHAHYDGPALALDAGALVSARSLWLSRSGRTILQDELDAFSGALSQVEVTVATESLEQPRRALDVREQERHGARRQGRGSLSNCGNVQCRSLLGRPDRQL